MATLPNKNIEMSYLEALLQFTLRRHKDIATARKYHAGDQPVYLTERAKEFLGSHVDNQFRLNICRPIVTALRDQLSVAGFDTGEKLNNGIKEQSAWAWNLWNENQMDSKQGIVHEEALRDGETFVIVDWDKDEKRPRFTSNQRFTDLSAGGDGIGCWIIYENDDPYQKPIVAVRQWMQTDILQPGVPQTYVRRTLYYPERVEKWIFRGGWEHYINDPDDPSEPWPIPWKDKKGKPLGIPVIHFKNDGLMPEAWDAIPMQDAVNKTLVDILASGDLTAFRMFAAFGWYPTIDGKAPASDGSNLIKVGPAQIVGTTKLKTEASLDVINGADITPLMETLKDLIVLTAQITGTPTSRFVMTAQVASEPAQREQQRTLEDKADNRRIFFGDAWEDCMKMARKLSNLYGNSNMNESVNFFTTWKHSKSIDDLQNKKKINVPEETLWSELGYTQEQIDSMKTTDEYRIASETALWTGAKAAIDAGGTLETYLRRIGWTDKQLAEFGTQKLAAIKVAQEDVIPPTGQ